MGIFRNTAPSIYKYAQKGTIFLNTKRFIMDMVYMKKIFQIK
ncbi:hypothetical protein LCGC14_1651200 [marine sediment metagenome]|uniref:Uncharacterized protein n=1 Tax=marine sediment metagenome TaxID=412755 RepID=A0A0F9IJ86_9ZZZZ